MRPSGRVGLCGWSASSAERQDFSRNVRLVGNEDHEPKAVVALDRDQFEPAALQVDVFPGPVGERVTGLQDEDLAEIA